MFHTVTGTRSASPKSCATGTSVQPRLGASTQTPVSRSINPGSTIVAWRIVRLVTFASRSASSRSAVTCPIERAGDAMADFRLRVAMIVPRPSATATVVSSTLMCTPTYASRVTSKSR